MDAIWTDGLEDDEPTLDGIELKEAVEIFNNNESRASYNDLLVITGWS